MAGAEGSTKNSPSQLDSIKNSTINRSNIGKFIREAEKLYEKGELSDEYLVTIIEKLNKFIDKNPYMESIYWARVQEFNALLLYVQDHPQLSTNSLREAYTFLPPGENFVLDWGDVNFSKDIATKPKTSSHKGRSWALALFVILLIYAWQPVADWRTVSFATPSEKTLADNLGLTSEGRKVFLKAHPEVIGADSIGQFCARDNNGDLEEGCYLPGTNKIYIRSMPDELKSEEIVTAAHEMLHSVYFHLSSGEQAQIDQMVERQFSDLNNDELNKRIAQYEQIEPGAKDIELYSILGSEFGGLNTDLANNYLKYFNNVQVEIGAAAQTSQTFDNYASQLHSLSQEIDTHFSQADSYYSSHARAAYAGDNYYRIYFYNLYMNELNAGNMKVDEYNALLEKYKILVDEYSGQQYTAKSSVTQQN